MERSHEVFNTIKSCFENQGWTYSLLDREFTLKTGFTNEGKHTDIIIRLDTEKSLIQIYSDLNFKVPNEKMLDVCIAISIVNPFVANGSFECNVLEGMVLFKVAQSYMGGCTVTEELIDYMIAISLVSIQDYSDSLSAIANGTLELEDFMRQFYNEKQ